MIRSRSRPPLLAALAAVLLAAAAPAPASADVAIGMYLSGSDTEPDQAVGDPFVGERSLYVWIDDYASALEFGLESDFEIVAVVPAPGFANVSNNVHSPYLYPVTPGSCLGGPEVAAEIVVRDATGDGGRVCFVPAAGSGRVCYSPCFSPGWSRFDGVFGWATSGVGGLCPPPVVDCEPVDVDRESWGELRSVYR